MLIEAQDIKENQQAYGDVQLEEEKNTCSCIGKLECSTKSHELQR